MRKGSGHVTVGDLPPMMSKLKNLNGMLTEKEISSILAESFSDTTQDIDFETFLRVLSDLCTSLHVYFSTLRERCELK